METPEDLEWTEEELETMQAIREARAHQSP